MEKLILLNTQLRFLQKLEFQNKKKIKTKSQKNFVPMDIANDFANV